MLRAYEAGGPTGTMREPNSTPMVTSWCGEKRPSHSRTVSYIRSVLGKSKAVLLISSSHTLDLPHPESPKDTIFAM